MKVLKTNPQKDGALIKGINYISTHDKRIHVVEFKVVDLDSLKGNIEAYDVVGIDEGQFFEKIVEFSEYLANRGIKVIISALNGNFKRNVFGKIGKLISKVEDITLLKSVCMNCTSKSASFSYRISDEVKQNVIGGKDKYMAVCRNCYNNIIHGKKSKTLSQ